MSNLTNLRADLTEHLSENARIPSPKLDIFVIFMTPSRKWIIMQTDFMAFIFGPLICIIRPVCHQCDY